MLEHTQEKMYVFTRCFLAHRVSIFIDTVEQPLSKEFFHSFTSTSILFLESSSELEWTLNHQKQLRNVYACMQNEGLIYRL